MSKYELYESQNESFEEFISRVMKCENFSAEALKGLVNEDFDNILYCKRPEGLKGAKGYETEIKYGYNGYYEFITTPIPRKIDIRFGCELETCFILNCRKEVRQEIEEILEGENIDKVKSKKWQNLILYHLKNNVIPYLTDEFIDIFRFAYIYPGYHSESGFFVDMKNGNLVNKNMKDEGYRTLIFEPDGSIKCDLSQNEDERGNVFDSIPIQCEIVTPVLSSIESLRILYEGLLPKHKDFPCNQSNASMGFHVNVSAVDEKGEIVKLTKGMFSELIYDWLPYERKNYKSLRGEKGSTHAQKIQSYIDDDFNLDVLDKIMTLKDGSPVENSNIYEPYGPVLWNTIYLINQVKMLSMTHHKKGNVVEFRVFNSSTDIEKLISYTQDAIDVFKGALNKYIKTPEKTLIQIQKSNLKYKHKDLPIPFLKSTFYSYDIYDIYKYLGILKHEFSFTDKVSLFGFKKERIFGGEELILDFDKVKICLSFYNNSYYLYDMEKVSEKSNKIIIHNPVQITKEKYYELNNQYYRYIYLNNI